ncbi:MAG TPA: DCC1-like thiol-disulfide oxidoreductase family protein [Chitinophagaceae bacterium]
MNANKILIYDDACPFCAWYTSLFVRCKLLPPQGRVEFSGISNSLLSIIDVERSKNEIPFIEVESGKVWYGIDALLNILGQKFPFVQKTGNFPPVKWFLKHLYKFISYNRKVIIAKHCGNGKFNCAPDLNISYRLMFMIVFFIFNTLMLIPIHQHVLGNVSFYELSLDELQKAHLLFAAVNCALALFLQPLKAIEYLGQVNMLAVITVLLMTPLIFFNTFLLTNELFSLAYLGAVTFIVMKEYFRRMRYAGIFSSGLLIAGLNLSCMFLFLVYLFVL